ncbi:MAG: hypothetical protein JO348_12935, partial [Alphaproteobacteria bacterium]|nr:hypothetical protein [Alphaproteobacteria bacterium]
MNQRYDAIVIGGNASGLAAAALLAKSKLKTLLVERATVLPTPPGYTLRALDPRVVKELKLAKRGLQFTVRDLALTALRAGAAPLVLGGDRHAAQRNLAALSPADAAAYATTHDELFKLARALRPTWWDGRPT